MSVSQNFPIISPSLNLDFANVQALDTRITFTRATTASYYGTQTALAEQNLLLQSAVPYPLPWAWTNGYIGTLGSELVTNGTFGTDVSGWTAGAGATITWVSGEAQVAGASATKWAYQTITTVIGKRYVFNYKQTGGTGSAVIWVGTSQGTNANGASPTTTAGNTLTSTLAFVATATTTFISLLSIGANLTANFDDLSVKESVQDFDVAPDGTSTASTLVADAANATYLQAVTANAADYTFSVFLRRVTGTGDVQIQAGSGTYVTQTITSTWARYTVTQTLAAGSRTAGIRLVTSGDQVEVWGAQLEQRSVTAYTPTTTQPITNYIPVLETAASGVARFDHNPTTFESLGLLIEEQRTNLLLRSDDFANASWSKTNTTVTSNTIVAPDSTLTGDALVVTSAGVQCTIAQTATLAAVASTFTCYIKAGSASWVCLGSNQFAADFGWFNVSTGVVGSRSGAVTASQIQAVGNGWYRCSVTGTFTANSNRTISVASADTVFTSPSVGSEVYIWGAQLEAGAFSTSYVQTVASQVTRAADAASMTGANFSSWYNAAEGTLYVEATKLDPSTNRFTAGIGFSSTQYIGMLFSTGSGNTFIQPSVGSFGTVAYNNTSFVKAGVGYKTGDYITSINGTNAISSSTAPVPTGAVGTLYLGTTGFSPSTITTSYFKKLSYYPIRLSNTNLQALTG